jgi:hypothetical protein
MKTSSIGQKRRVEVNKMPFPSGKGGKNKLNTIQSFRSRRAGGRAGSFWQGNWRH